jgi:hypothetical protein
MNEIDTNERHDVTIHIERLVLDGFAMNAAEAGRVRLAIELELARLFTEQGAPASLASIGSVPSMPAAGVQYAPQTSGADLGASVARSLYRSFGAPSHGASHTLSPTTPRTGSMR